MRDMIATVMNSDRNPLNGLPKAQRFQIMVFLSTMWTVIFCVGIGNWMWFGELVTAHVGIALGAIMTGVTFRRASREAVIHRDLYRHPDGGTRYDDIWGG